MPEIRERTRIEMRAVPGADDVPVPIVSTMVTEGETTMEIDHVDGDGNTRSADEIAAFVVAATALLTEATP